MLIDRPGWYFDYLISILHILVLILEHIAIRPAYDIEMEPTASAFWLQYHCYELHAYLLILTILWI